MYYIIMLRKLILQIMRFNLCTEKKSFKYYQTLITPISVCAQDIFVQKITFLQQFEKILHGVIAPVVISLADQ